MTTLDASPEQAVEHDDAVEPSRQRVLVAYDGSSSSAAALTWAAREAGSRGARLRVLFAADAEGADVGGAAVLAEMAHAAGVEIAEEGASWATTLDGGPPREAVETDVRLARPDRALVQASRGADLLVMGNRGRGAIAGALLGSVAFSVIAQAACPVVVVRGDSERRPGPEHPVVVGVDGSDGALASVDFAAAEAARTGAPLIVVAAWTPPDLVASGGHYGVSYVADLGLRAQSGAQASADAALQRTHASHPDLTGEVRLVRDKPAKALVDTSVDAGLLVVGARGRGSVRGLFLGSVSHAAVHGAPCPVAVVRQEDERPPADR